jgi:hypothetical protein
MLIVAVTGCAESTETASRGVHSTSEPTQRTNPAPGAESRDVVPFNLYTHCRIGWAKIRGTFWHAENETSDGPATPGGLGESVSAWSAVLPVSTHRDLHLHCRPGDLSPHISVGTAVHLLVMRSARS